MDILACLKTASGDVTWTQKGKLYYWNNSRLDQVVLAKCYFDRWLVSWSGLDPDGIDLAILECGERGRSRAGQAYAVLVDSELEAVSVAVGIRQQFCWAILGEL